jgi:RNA polymerase sigma-70 factor (ECF subfamily)
MLSNAPIPTTHDDADLAAAREHDGVAFARLVAPYRGGLYAHCYRMLGSSHDAEDALQEALLRAWRGLPRYERRASLRTWLYTIATNVSLKALERRRRRVLPLDHGPPSDPHGRPDAAVSEPLWLEPFPDDVVADGRASPEARYEQRESVELAFVAALHHLPPRQRAVLLLRDVLGFAPAEIAEALDATPAAVYSTLQRAHAAVEDRLPERSQQATLRSLGDQRLRSVVERYVQAWEDGDVDAIMAMLTADATFAMPPRPSWYLGREAIGTFLAAYPLSLPRWRLVPARASGQLAFGTYLTREGRREAHSLEVITLDGDGQIAAVMSFHRPEAFPRFGLRPELKEVAR